MDGFMMSMFQIWLAIGIILIAAEVMTTTFFLLWPAIGAFVVAILTWIFPEFSFIGQLLVFAFVSAVLLVPGRKMVMPLLKKNAGAKINDRMAMLIGQKATVTSIDGTNLRVKLGDTEWSAVSGQELTLGDIVNVTGSQGNVLVVAVG